MSNLVELELRQLKGHISPKDIYSQVLFNQNLLTRESEMLGQIMEILQQYGEYFPPIENKKTYSESKYEINVTLQMLFKKLNLKFIDLEVEFEDIHYRIYNFGLIQKLLNEIINNLNEIDVNQKYLMRMSIVIHDLIRKVKSENLTKEHLDIIRKGFLIITSGKATRDDVRNLDNSLLDSGLDWIYG